jgi:hypothetical protein
MTAQLPHEISQMSLAGADSAIIGARRLTDRDDVTDPPAFDLTDCAPKHRKDTLPGDEQ